MKQQHYFHLVSYSPWPLFTAVSLLFVTIGGALHLHLYILGTKFLILGILLLFFCMFLWWNDVIIESTFQGNHTFIVQQGLRYGVVLFIISEVMFFFSFFWSFFHSSLSPNIEIGCIWPPAEIKVFNPWEVPLLNTLLLLSSGCTVTWAHYLISNPCPLITSWLDMLDLSKFKIKTVSFLIYNEDKGDIETSTFAFKLTLFLALCFTGFQVFEYFEAPFSILDGIYGSTFFMLTGFHGLHVIIGTIFLAVCAIRNEKSHFSTDHHLGFEAAVWYWHFVDVVWLFLFVILYLWGAATFY